MHDFIQSYAKTRGKKYLYYVVTSSTRGPPLQNQSFEASLGFFLSREGLGAPLSRAS